MNSFKDLFRYGRMLLLRFFYRTHGTPLPFYRKPLIVAPHPDDEVFGCGGLILRTLSGGGRPFVVFLTDGESSLKGYHVDAGTTADNRKTLTMNAAEVMRLEPGDLAWLHLPDGRLPGPGENTFADAVTVLAAVIAQVGPDAVFVTHPLDSWSDHIAAAAIACETVRQMTDRPAFYYYAVWLWYSMGLKKVKTAGRDELFLLGITEWIENKKAAITAYTGGRSSKGHPWSGYLPSLFIKAFDWPFEVFEKVKINH